MQEQYHKWYTQYLSRDFEMLVFGETGYPVILFPPAKGRYYDCKDHGLINSIADFIENGKIKVYCPDTVDHDSWFNYDIDAADRVVTQIAYERVIHFDVLEFARYETARQRIGMAGCNFGAYHAVNFAFRHPDMISSLFSIGGSLDIKQHIFGYYDDNCYFNSPLDYLPGLNDSWYLDNIREMNIIIGAGGFDFTLDQNKYLSYLLTEKGIKHKFDKPDGLGHDWNSWRQMFRNYCSQLDLSS